jgi:hypothetical protein
MPLRCAQPDGGPPFNTNLLPNGDFELDAGTDVIGWAVRNGSLRRATNAFAGRLGGRVDSANNNNPAEVLSRATTAVRLGQRYCARIAVRHITAQVSVRIRLIEINPEPVKTIVNAGPFVRLMPDAGWVWLTTPGPVEMLFSEANGQPLELNVITNGVDGEFFIDQATVIRTDGQTCIFP